jgi:hypothetical protein
VKISPNTAKIKKRDSLKNTQLLILLFFISLSISLVLIEIIAKKYINERILKYEAMQKKGVIRYYNDKNTNEFKNKYIDRLSHLRHPNFVILKEAPPSELLFSVVRPFSNLNIQNILIQGDSWAQIARQSQSFLKETSERNHFGIVNAGVGSYSPSPMTIQLDILRDDFDIHPSVIIGIIDQTDIGDELTRYTYQHEDETGRLRSLLPKGTTLSKNTQFIERKKNFNSSKLSLIKILNLAMLYVKSKYLNRKVPSLNQNTKKILSPLVNGVDFNLAKIFFIRLNRYIKTVFSDPEVKKLILVTHPHRNHLVDTNNPKRFKGEVGTLVNQVVSKSNYKNKILHLDFLKSEKSNFLIKNLETIFVKNDPFSHLTNKMYSDYYFPFIFSKVKDLK